MNPLRLFKKQNKTGDGETGDEETGVEEKRKDALSRIQRQEGRRIFIL